MLSEAAANPTERYASLVLDNADRAVSGAHACILSVEHNMVSKVFILSSRLRAAHGDSLRAMLFQHEAIGKKSFSF